MKNLLYPNTTTFSFKAIGAKTALVQGQSKFIQRGNVKHKSTMVKWFLIK